MVSGEGESGRMGTFIDAKYVYVYLHVYTLVNGGMEYTRMDVPRGIKLPQGKIPMGGKAIVCGNYVYVVIMYTYVCIYI